MRRRDEVDDCDASDRIPLSNTCRLSHHSRKNGSAFNDAAMMTDFILPVAADMYCEPPSTEELPDRQPGTTRGGWFTAGDNF